MSVIVLMVMAHKCCEILSEPKINKRDKVNYITYFFQDTQ